jgi:acyl carrier protein
MNEQVLNRVREIASDVLQVDGDAITPDSSPENVASWDSVQHLNLVLALEDEYGLQFLPEEMDQMKTVGEIAQLVAAKCAA